MPAPKHIPIYAFQYKNVPGFTERYLNFDGSSPVYSGVMAQDLLILPDLEPFKSAVEFQESSGYYAVDYSTLDVDFGLYYDN